MTASYQVEIRIKTGISRADVIGKMADLFHVTADKLEEALSNNNSLFKHGLDLDTAKKYQLALENCGCICMIEPDSQNTQVPQLIKTEENADDRYKRLESIHIENGELQCEWSGKGVFITVAFVWIIFFAIFSVIPSTNKLTFISVWLLMFLPSTFQLVRLYLSGPALIMTASGIQYANTIYQWHDIYNVRICPGVKGGPYILISLKSKLYQGPYLFRQSDIQISTGLLNNPAKFVGGVTSHLLRNFQASEN